MASSSDQKRFAVGRHRRNVMGQHKLRRRLCHFYWHLYDYAALLFAVNTVIPPYRGRTGRRNRVVNRRWLHINFPCVVNVWQFTLGLARERPFVWRQAENTWRALTDTTQVFKITDSSFRETTFVIILLSCGRLEKISTRSISPSLVRLHDQRTSPTSSRRAIRRGSPPTPASSSFVPPETQSDCMRDRWGL